MIFLRLCCVRMYAAFCPKYRYIGRMLTGRDYIWGRESRQVKSAKNLTIDRNSFTESRFSEQQHGCAETQEIIRFRAKSRSSGKSIGVTCGQDIVTVILREFDVTIFCDAAKWTCRRAYRLCFFIIRILEGI